MMTKRTNIAITAFLILAFTAPLFAAEKTSTIKVYGMVCSMCANGLSQTLQHMKGVKSAKVSLKDADAVVVYDDQQVGLAQIKKQIDQAGFSTEPQSK